MEDFDIVSVGEVVPTFKIDTFNPQTKKFGTFSFNPGKSNKKWTVLVFYPADFTFVCPTELADFGNKYKEISSLNVDLISISTDTKFVHMAWQSTERLLKDIKFEMGADPTANLAQMFNVYDYEEGHALRATLIINPVGVLVSAEINAFDVGRDADELVRKLKAYIYVSTHPGEACPAKWSEKDKTLKPSEKLVGNVASAI
ncbi:redoxin domain-containing protein [Patescibacteria group bacterium]|nr:redoxin domain-containing protein [Patescibacteria group bacterium]